MGFSKEENIKKRRFFIDFKINSQLIPFNPAAINT